jgi:hypothetical protein
MTPEADAIHTRLLRYDWIDHRADRCHTAIEAAWIILKQAEKIEQLQAALRSQGGSPNPV